ncbi:MAG: hypothetical protein WCI51_02275 [Lentisphaerota bacterium]
MDRREAIIKMNANRDKHATITVVYVRPDGSRLSVPATPGKTVFRYTDQRNQSVVEETRDYLVTAELLSFEPERGDTIVEAGLVYQVAAPNQEPLWRWHDSFRICRRIHAKLIGEA